jgi:hypothetical protein
MVGALAEVDGNARWVDRAVDQNGDLAWWIRYFRDPTQNPKPLIGEINDEWRRCLEISTFALEAADDSHIKDEQKTAGWVLIRELGKSGQWTQDEVEKTAILVSLTSAHMHPELFDMARTKPLLDLLDPAKAGEMKALIRERLTPPEGPAVAAKWLDQPGELDQLRDALFVLKVADRTRGDAAKLQRAYGVTDPIAAMSKDRIFTSQWVQAYVQAVRAQ